MYDTRSIENNLNLKDGLETLKYRFDFRKDEPTYFDADGLIVFTGAQGTGKTLSAVRYVKKLMENYPHCKLVTNLMIKEYPIVTLEQFIADTYTYQTANKFEDLSEYSQYKIISDYMYLNQVFPFKNNDDLLRYHNGQEGVIYLIDEIQLYLNSLQSKNISMELLTEISQQRKQRKHIICTSQIFGRLAKPLREQFNTVVECRNYFDILQVNFFRRQEDVQMDADDMKPKGQIYQRQIFFHKVVDYESYDTFYKIQNNKWSDIEGGVQHIYDRFTTNAGQ